MRAFSNSRKEDNNIEISSPEPCNNGNSYSIGLLLYGTEQKWYNSYWEQKFATISQGLGSLFLLNSA